MIFSSRHDEVFHHGIKVEKVLFAWVCSQEVREITGERRKNSSEDEEKILIKGGSLFTMAVLGQVARLRNGSIFMKSMDEEQITSKHGKERLQKYARYAIEAYLNGVKDMQENIGG